MKAWVSLLLVGAVLAYGYLDARRRARVDRGPRHHRTDFTVYQVAAEALRDGTDPYEARNPRGYRYVYPPLLAVLLQPVAKMEPPDAAYLFFILSAALLAWSLLMLARLRPWRDRPLGWAPVLLALGLCFGFAHQGFQRGQITHALLALQVGAFALALRQRFVGAGLALGFASVLRLTPLLPAGVLGLGLLAMVRTRGWRPVLRYSGGLAAALLLGIVVIPWASLGASRAQEVTERWVEVTRAIYTPGTGAKASLEKDYAINEFRFKNQAPRRVAMTYAGWIEGAGFERERPALSSGATRGAEGVSTGVALFVLLAAAWLGWSWLRRPETPQAALAYMLAVALPVLVTRYTWPTHFLMVLPLLAILLGRTSVGGRTLWARLLQHLRAMPRAVWAFFLATALFYAAHARALQPIGEAGCLLVGALVLFAGAWHVGRTSKAPDHG